MEDRPIDYGIEGTVFDIKRFATGDGPGIRTLIFLKGCPLSCVWCSNPESQSSRPEILYVRTKCVGCGACLAACPVEAIVADSSLGYVSRRDRCTACGRCVEACLHEARELVGRPMSVRAVMMTLRRDRRFFDHSGGGVTLGGGEPLLQSRFASEILRASRWEDIHTAIETAGQVPWPSLASVLPHLDLLFFDVKHLDPEASVEGTGQTGEQALSNLERVTESDFGGEIIVRVPFVPGFNDSDEVQRRIYSRVAGLRRVERIEVMPYHRFGMAKYAGLGRPYALEGVAPINKKDLAHLVRIGAECGIEVRIDST
jgi:pyruvate formate lyase activating enzyme